MTKRYVVKQWEPLYQQYYTSYFFGSINSATNFMKDIFEELEGLKSITGEGLEMKILLHVGGYTIEEVKD